MLTLIQAYGHLFLGLLPLLLWIAWCLFCMDWKKTWPWLAQGAWAPAILLVIIASLVWSQIKPGPLVILNTVTIANFWWQLAAVLAIAGVALFCGWLQGILGWQTMEVAVEPTENHDEVHGDDSDGHTHSEEPATAAHGH